MKKSLGERIKSIRLEKGYTMEDFGKLFNTSKGTVNNWEKGRNNPNRENLKKIAQLGNTTVDELLDVNSQLRIETSKYIYNNLLSDYSKETYIGTALRYFSETVVNEMLTEIANKKLESSFHINKNKYLKRYLTIEDVDSEDRYYQFMKRKFVDKYQNEVKTNTNLILNTAQQLTNIQDPYAYKIYDWGETYYSDDERYTVSVEEVEKSVNEELIDNIYSILQEAYTKIDELKKCYPDELPERNLDFILNYEDDEQFESKVIKSINIEQLEKTINTKDKNELEEYRIEMTKSIFEKIGLRFIE